MKLNRIFTLPIIVFFLNASGIYSQTENLDEVPTILYSVAAPVAIFFALHILFTQIKPSISISIGN